MARMTVSVCLLALPSGYAQAQDTSPQVPAAATVDTPDVPSVVSPDSGMVTESPSVDLTPSAGSLTVPEDLWLRLDRAQDRSRRTRIALLAGTGAFAVGTILAIAWSAKNCSSADGISACDTDAQPGLGGTGGFLLTSGAITMLTSGIMLGVRNRHKRNVINEIEQYRASRAHWDFESGVLRF